MNFPGQEWRVHEAALSSHFVGEALEDKDGVREYGIRVIKHLPDELDFTIARNLLIELARAVIWLDERNDSEASR